MFCSIKSAPVFWYFGISKHRRQTYAKDKSNGTTDADALPGIRCKVVQFKISNDFWISSTGTSLSGYVEEMSVAGFKVTKVIQPATHKLLVFFEIVPEWPNVT